MNQPSIPKHQMFLSVLSLTANTKSQVSGHLSSDSSYSFNIFRLLLSHLRRLPW